MIVRYAAWVTIAAFLLLPTTLWATVGSLDPEAAARACTDTLQGADRKRSDAYFEGGYRLLLWGAIIGMALFLLAMDWKAGHIDNPVTVTLAAGEPEPGS